MHHQAFGLVLEKAIPCVCVWMFSAFFFFSILNECLYNFPPSSSFPRRFTTAGGPDISWMGNSLSAGHSSSGGRSLLGEDTRRISIDPGSSHRKPVKGNEFVSTSVWNDYCDSSDILKVSTVR